MAIAIYARVSTESDDQAHALEQQLHRLRSKATDLGETVVEFIDVASGTRDDRPQLKRLLEQCEQGLISTVLCTRLDRMSRSTVGGGKLLRLFNQPTWPNLICLDQPIDLSTATGRFYASLLMGMAQMESELIGERVHHGQMYARVQLKPQAGKPPWGYRYSEGKTNYLLDETAAPLAQQLVAHFLATASVPEAFAFQRQHCGQPFRSMEGMRRWLQNPALAGHRVYGTCVWTMDVDGSKRRKLKRPGEVDEIHPHAHPALITPGQQEEIAQIMQAQSKRRLTAVRPRRTRVLTGLVFCDHCGHLMHHRQPRQDGPHYLTCRYDLCSKRPRNSIREDVAVTAAIQALADRRELLAYGGVIDELRLRRQLSPEVQELQRQIRDLKLLDDPEVAEVVQRKTVRLDGLLRETVSNGGSRFSLENAVAAMDQQEVWDELLATPQRQRALFSQWLERLVVRDGEVVDARLRAGG